MFPIHWNYIPLNISNVQNHSTFKTRLQILLLRRQYVMLYTLYTVYIIKCNVYSRVDRLLEYSV